TSATGGDSLDFNGVYALGRIYSTGYNAAFDVAEILVYNQLLNNIDRQNVENYLYYKYATPPINLGPDISIAYGMCGVSIDATARYADYHWSTGDTTQAINITQSGNYSVTVTNGFGETSTDDVYVNFPQINVHDTVLCLGSAVAFSSLLGNDYSYLWLPDSITTNSINITQPGTYSLTVFDTLGCQRTQTFTVVVDSFPVQASLGPDRNICQGDYITLTNGAQQAVSYLWSDNSGNSYLPINGAPGTTPAYSVTVTNANGCLAVDTVILNINGVMPTVAFSNDSVCQGSATHFTDLSSVTAPYTIASRLWDFGDSTASTAQNPAHIYAEDGIYQAVLTVVTDSGCTRSFQNAVMVFSVPAVNFLPYEGCSGVAVHFSDITECPYGNVNSWHWEFGDSYGAGNDTSIQPNPVYTYDSAGTFTVSLVVASVAGCVDSAAHTITVKASPEVAFSNTAACAGNLVYFTNETIIPPWESITYYQWKFGDGTVSAVSNPSHIFDTAGTYDVTLTVRSLSGCEVSATIPVVIGAIPEAAFGYTNNCFHITSQFSDSSTSTQGLVNQWEWDFGGLGTSSMQNPGFMFPDTGNYVVSLTVVTDHGCADSTSATVRVYPLPVAAFDLDPEYGIPPLPVNFTNQSVGADHFLWAFGDGDTDTVAEPVHTFLTQGIFNVLLTAYSANGCYDTISHNAYVLPTSVDIAVKNAMITLTDNRLTVSADLLNMGSRKIEHIDIAMQMENGSIIHEQWYGALMQGDNVHYVFNAQPEVPAGQRVDFVCVTASLLPELEEVMLENNRSCPVLESSFSLSEPYPNPVAGNMVIGYVLPFSGEVSIELYNEMGEMLAELFSGDRPEGYNTQTFDMSALPGGVYALKVVFHDTSLRKKFVKM
ncbi:MAG TPA: PKD domain-containing protein, partial [Bacteroidales bacterium]|nr:PKD domain-containing protein [Bacteroidales bacterium]HQN16371.1 PKD domain-containing protein [Bacteroidales bacterium]